LAWLHDDVPIDTQFLGRQMGNGDLVDARDDDSDGS